MTALLDQAVADYLAVRRSLGFKLAENGRELPDFVAYLDASGATTITTQVAVGWATRPQGCSPVRWAQRLAMVRGFARHMKAIDPDTEVPPLGVLPHRCRRVEPYVYTDAEVAELMAAARGLRPALWAATLETMIGLLAVTGMRSGEVLRLDRDHIDWDEAVISVWNSKFAKSRAIPLHPSTLETLERYGHLRDHAFPRPSTSSFFVYANGARVSHDSLNHFFSGLIRKVGLDRPGRRPRPHDLRHRFAVKTLIGWYRAGLNVEANMTLLSTYLGHSRPEHTYWYLSAVPELLRLASERMEQAEGSRP